MPPAERLREPLRIQDHPANGGEVDLHGFVTSAPQSGESVLGFPHKPRKGSGELALLTRWPGSCEPFDGLSCRQDAAKLAAAGAMLAPEAAHARLPEAPTEGGEGGPVVGFWGNPRAGCLVVEAAAV